MTDEQKPPSPPDWSRLAIEALDLWQNHITTLANDPVAKAELARMMQPVGQMASEWARMMQAQNPYANGQNTETAASAAGTDASAPATGDGPATPAGSGAGSDDAPRNDGVDTSGLSEPSLSDAAPSSVAAAPGSQVGGADRKPSPSPSPDVGNAAPATGAGDMAELAQRLAELERRMDERRSHTRFKRRDDLENMDEPAERQASAASGG